MLSLTNPASPEKMQQRHWYAVDLDLFQFPRKPSNGQIDRVGERLRGGEEFCVDDWAVLRDWRQFLQKPLRATSARIVTACHEIIAEDTPAVSRTKTLGSIIAKLHREKMRLSQMQDVVGCRIVVPHMSQQTQIVTAIQEHLVDASRDGDRWQMDDRRSRPSYNYRAVHFIHSTREGHVEIQVRTYFQDLWAQMSERLDRIVPGFKYGQGPENIQALLGRLSHLIELIEQVELLPMDEDERTNWRSTVLPSLDEMMKQLTTHLETRLG